MSELSGKAHEDLVRADLPATAAGAGSVDVVLNATPDQPWTRCSIGTRKTLASALNAAALPGFLPPSISAR